MGLFDLKLFVDVDLRYVVVYLLEVLYILFDDDSHG